MVGIIYRLRQDNSSHWYAIPKSYIDEFDECRHKIDIAEDYSNMWYDLCDEFDEKYSKFRMCMHLGEYDIIFADESDNG